MQWIMQIYSMKLLYSAKEPDAMFYHVFFTKKGCKIFHADRLMRFQVCYILRPFPRKSTIDLLLSSDPSSTTSSEPFNHIIEWHCIVQVL